MQLLNTRIEIQPGRKPQVIARGMGGEGDIGQGSTLLTVTNTQGYENAFRVRVQCDAPFWQEEWVKLRALPFAPVAGVATVTGAPIAQQTQRDQYGAQDRWIRLFVPQKQQRDVQILFDLPQNPQSRAGLYPLKILIEEEAIGGGGNARGGAGGGRRVHTLSAQLLVLPFYRWSMETKPRQAHLGWIKRTNALEVVVRNQGNDWLYCALNLPDASTDPNALQIKNKLVTRVAVPPPPPDDSSDAKGSERSIHFVVAGGPSSLRGAPLPLPLGLTATRLNAPTYPPWRDPNTGELHTGAVMTEETSEQSALPPASGALYYPLIPSQITQAADGAGGFVRGLAGTVAGLLVAVHIGVFLFEQALHNNINASVLNNRVKVGDWITVKGNWLPGSKILVKGDKDSGFAPVKAELGKPVGNKLQKNVQFMSFKAEEDLDGQTVQVRVQRVGVLPWLSAILPSSLARPRVTVGETAVAGTTPIGGTTPGGTTSPIGTPTPVGGLVNNIPPGPKGGPTGGANGGSSDPANGGANGGGGNSANPQPTPPPLVPTPVATTAATPSPLVASAQPVPTPRPTRLRPTPPFRRPNNNGGGQVSAGTPPTYDRLLLRDYNGASNAGDKSLLGRAIAASALASNPENSDQAAQAARAVQSEAQGRQGGLAYAVAGTVLMTQSAGAAIMAPDTVPAVSRQIQSTFQAGASRAPDCVLNYTVAATSLHSLRQDDAARSILEQGEKKAIGSTKAAPIALAWAWHELEQNDRARALLNRALEQSPELRSDPQVQELQSALR